MPTAHMSTDGCEALSAVRNHLISNKIEDKNLKETEFSKILAFHRIFGTRQNLQKMQNYLKFLENLKNYEIN